MSDTASQAGADDGRVLRMSRIFAAPRETVFRAWTDPDEFSKWWGPEGCTSHCEVEPRVGGAWRSRMVLAGGAEHVLSGEYLEFVVPERLVFTWQWNFERDAGLRTVVTLDFIERDGSTEISMTQERFDTVEARDKHNDGWSGSLDCLQTYLTEAGETQ